MLDVNFNSTRYTHVLSTYQLAYNSLNAFVENTAAFAKRNLFLGNPFQQHIKVLNSRRPLPTALRPGTLSFPSPPSPSALGSSGRRSWNKDGRRGTTRRNYTTRYLAKKNIKMF